MLEVEETVTETVHDEYASIIMRLTEELSIVAPQIHICVVKKGDKMSDMIQEITEHYQRSSVVMISAKGAAVQKMVSMVEISKKSIDDKGLQQFNKLEQVLEETTKGKDEEKLLNEISNTKKVFKRPVMSVLLAKGDIDTTSLLGKDWHANS